MQVSLKPISEQVIVITGATSGIGLATARRASKLGARVVLVARNESALRKCASELGSRKGRAIAILADVGRERDVEQVFSDTIDAFGGFDTWVNNAGVSIYGPLEQVPIEDMKRLFDTNFWGQVYGSLAALRHLKEHGGAIINVGSTVSDRAFPLQGIYSASKHALKAFTDSLRMEAHHAGYPVSLTLIKPAAIDTPYTDHARSYLGVYPKNPPPRYAPERVARAILYAATHPERDITVGGAARVVGALGRLLPSFTDRVMEGALFSAQHTNVPDEGRSDNLYTAGDDLSERSDTPGQWRLPSGGTLALAALAGIGAMLATREP